VINLIFVAALGAALWLALRWAFHHFPGEEWQFLAAVPKSRQGDGVREGTNLTYYGVLSATAYTLGVALFLVMAGSIGITRLASCALILLLLALCVPASRWVARIVENKRHTFTVGGASFVGMILAPWMIALFNGVLGLLGKAPVPNLAVLAAIAIAYAFGEGIGRLACISFGCCYGRSLETSHPFWRKAFENRHFVFSGKTKKIAYASGLDGQPVIPIQALTAVCYIATGLASMALFLTSCFGAAFLLSVGVTQAWRAFSEFLRADYRGEQPISAYQIMAALAVAYAFLVRWALPAGGGAEPSIMVGLEALWDPGILLLLQGLWVATFLYTGRSTVTGSTLSFHVFKDRI
jgi:prolipoprotein diacylglyceryltransferase